MAAARSEPRNSSKASAPRERSTSSSEPASGTSPGGLPSQRLDVWLDVACLFKTRSEAKRACEGGKVDVNGDGAKPHRAIREGDRIRISRGFGQHQDVIVRVLIDQHVRKSEARALYDDVTPKPTAEEMEIRRIDRAYVAAARAAGTPDRRRRQEIRRHKEKT
jgi:ribosome-associated heat shock protein Hsp15